MKLPQGENKENQKPKEFSRKKIVGLFLLVVVIGFFSWYGEKHEQKQLVDDYNSYAGIIDKDLYKINSIINKYPKDLSNEEYLNYVNEYVLQATYLKQHLLEFRAFINANEDELKRLGVNTIEHKSLIDDSLATMDRTARAMETNVREIQENREMASNLLKALASLLI